MHEIIIEKDYSGVIKTISDGSFCLYGETRMTDVLFLYLKNQKVACSLERVIVPSLSTMKRNVTTRHGVDIVEPDWLETSTVDFVIIGLPLEEAKQVYDNIVKYNEKIRCIAIEDDGHLKAERELYDFYINKLSADYNLVKNEYEQTNYNISMKKSDCFYKYYPRIFQGLEPDERLFWGDENLDEQFENKLGSFYYVDEKTPICDLSHGIGKKETSAKCQIYVASSAMDRQLIENRHIPYAKTIQVGTALTDERTCDCQDDVGDNISKRNRDYCEMTAVYWMWKNDNIHDYVGLCHYRRCFVIEENKLDELIDAGYDSIYTVPKITDGGMYHEFVTRNGYLSKDTWDIVTEAIESVAPFYLAAWHEFRDSQFFIPFNMSIMKKEVFKEYCEFQFSVLNKVDEYYLNTVGIRNDRYLGYIAECLTTVFAMAHRDEHRRAFVDVHILKTL